VRALAETVELANEIDLGRAKNAQLKAEEMLRTASLDEHQFKKYELKLQRAIIRQEVAGKSL
jgi:F-type H+-transporting ATPase subunit epsilon